MGVGSPTNHPRKAMSEINVTPLVDIMLVLLVIFMVTAPMMKQGLNVNLPETKGEPTKSEKKSEPIIVTLKKDQTILVGKTKVALDLLSDKIKSMSSQIEDARVFLEADKKVTYELVAKVMGEIQSAGVFKISLITVPPK